MVISLDRWPLEGVRASWSEILHSELISADLETWLGRCSLTGPSELNILETSSDEILENKV